MLYKNYHKNKLLYNTFKKNRLCEKYLKNYVSKQKNTKDKKVPYH